MSHIEVIVDVVANDSATSDVDISLVVAVASVDALALAVVVDGSYLAADREFGHIAAPASLSFQLFESFLLDCSAALVLAVMPSNLCLAVPQPSGKDDSTHSYVAGVTLVATSSQWHIPSPYFVPTPTKAVNDWSGIDEQLLG